MPIYGYIRVSGDRQAKSGLGLAAQTKRIEQHVRGLPGRKLTRLFRDAAVSAARKPLLERPQGWQLDQALQRGDHVIFAKLDRACRNLLDFAGLLDRWHKRGVFVHLLDIGIDTSTPTGQMVAGIMASIAQWESQRIGERISEAKAVLRARGRTTNGHEEIGYRLVRGRLLPDPLQRAVRRRILGLQRAGHSLHEIARRLNRNQLRTVQGKPWSHQAVWRAARKIYLDPPAERKHHAAHGTTTAQSEADQAQGPRSRRATARRHRR